MTDQPAAPPQQILPPEPPQFKDYITKRVAAQEVYAREKATLYACGVGFIGYLFTFGLSQNGSVWGLGAALIFSISLIIIAVKAIKDMNRINTTYDLGHKKIDLKKEPEQETGIIKNR